MSPKPRVVATSSSPRSTNANPRSVLPLALDILRIVVIMFSTACVVSKAAVVFGGKASIFEYISNNPVLWTVRYYKTVFHLVVILVELDVGIPVILPKKTLDNFLHKGYIVSFIGLLDLCMSSNKSLADLVDELQGEEVLSEKKHKDEIRVCSVGNRQQGYDCLWFALLVVGYNRL